MDSVSNHEKFPDYIHNLFKVYGPYILAEEERLQISRGLKTFIVQKLLRKKYRKQKLLDQTISDITKKVSVSVQENRPLHFAIPFGGYKHFWNSSHPEPDWAELFTLHSLTEWLAPILAAYEPGGIIEFISEDMILPRMNNYPDVSLDAYAKCFSELLEIYKKISPKNLHFEYFRVGNKFDKKR